MVIRGRTNSSSSWVRFRGALPGPAERLASFRGPLVRGQHTVALLSCRVGEADMILGVGAMSAPATPRGALVLPLHWEVWGRREASAF